MIGENKAFEPRNVGVTSSARGLEKMTKGLVSAEIANLVLTLACAPQVKAPAPPLTDTQQLTAGQISITPVSSDKPGYVLPELVSQKPPASPPEEGQKEEQPRPLIPSLPETLQAKTTAVPPQTPPEKPPAHPPEQGPTTTWQELANLNNLPNPNQIYAGQALKIPDGSTYVITFGDTLASITRRYNAGTLETIPKEQGGFGSVTTPASSGVCTSNIECSEGETCYSGVCTKGEKTLASECAEGETHYARVCIEVGEAASPNYPPLDGKIKIIWGEEGTALLNSAQKQQYESLIREAVKGLTEYLGEGFVEGEITIQVPADQPRFAGGNRAIFFQPGKTESSDRVGHEIIHGLVGGLPTPGFTEGLATYLQAVAFDSQERAYDDLKYYQEVYHLALRQGVKFSAEYFYIPQSGNDYYSFSMAAFADLEEKHPGFAKQFAWRLRDFQGETLSLDQTKAIVEEVWPGGWEEVGKHQILLWSGVPVLW